MKLLDDYFTIQQEIYDYFGYKEDWAVIPIEDSREMFWRISDDDVWFAEKEENLQDDEAGNYCANEIYKQRFLPKWVYVGKEYTMIVVDTGIDGNKFLQIFSNDKRRMK